jgi:arginyl-tRNA synthetase
VIAFDFKDALSFEGETGPYAQYAVVRATSIFKKAGLDPDSFTTHVATGASPVPPAQSAAASIPAADLTEYLTNESAHDSAAAESANEFWSLWLAAAHTSHVVDQSVATTEPAYLAKHVFQLAQLFNTFYHRHPILAEPDEKRKQFLLVTVAVVRRELIAALAVMGITVPPVM